MRPAGFFALLLVLLCACRVSLSPLKNRLGIGTEPYLVFDAAGESGEGDLYAVSAAGGPVYRVTFSRVHESEPKLSPDGTMLAFIRSRTAGDTATRQVWIMNLLNGAERRIESPEGAGPPREVGWSPGGELVFIRSGEDYVAAAPPEAPAVHRAAGAEAAQADSAFRVWLGDPPVAEAVRCPGDAGLCAQSAGGTQVLSRGGRQPIAWGADSVAYLVGDELEVRPLGGGTIRRPRWSNAPSRIGSLTYFPGRPGSDDGELPAFRSPFER